MLTNNTVYVGSGATIAAAGRSECFPGAAWTKACQGQYFTAIGNPLGNEGACIMDVQLHKGRGNMQAIVHAKVALPIVPKGEGNADGHRT